MKQRKTYQVSFQDARSSLLVDAQRPFGIRLFGGLDLCKVLLNSLEFVINCMVLRVGPLDLDGSWMRFKLAQC